MNLGRRSVLAGIEPRGHDEPAASGTSNAHGGTHVELARSRINDLEAVTDVLAHLAILNDSFVDGKSLFKRYETVAVRIKPGEEIVLLAGKANDSALDLFFFKKKLFLFLPT